MQKQGADNAESERGIGSQIKKPGIGLKFKQEAKPVHRHGPRGIGLNGIPVNNAESVHNT